MPKLSLGGGEGFCCAQEAPVPAVPLCETCQEEFGADSPHLGGRRAEWLFGVCVLASCQATAVLQPRMALACVCGESWGQCLLTSLDWHCRSVITSLILDR